jgi:hypothetical protein
LFGWKGGKVKKRHGSLLIPVGSFVVAVVLSLLINGGMIRQVIARQAGGGTPCTGNATGTAITVAVGNAVKRGIPWEFQVTNQPVTTTNSLAATLTVLDEVALNATNVTAIDNKGGKHTWPNYPLVAFYTPTMKFNMAAGGGTVNAVITKVNGIAALTSNLEDDINTAWAQAKLGITVKKITATFNAQVTNTSQNLRLVCTDGTLLGSNPRPVTPVNVNQQGNGGPVNN